MDLKQEITQQALRIGFDQVGITTANPPARAPQLDRWLAEGRHGDMTWMERNPERRKDLRQVLPSARSMVAVAMNYHMPGGDESSSKGVVARYSRGKDYHKIMRGMLKELAEFIRRAGGAGTEVFTATDTSALLERELAERAGLGWVGKSTLLLNRSLGTWFLLGEILTSLELEPDEPARGYCGSCTSCMDACPTRAITAPYQLDARRCIAYLTIESREDIPEEFREAVGNRIFGCDDCLTACPWNRFAQEAKTFKHYHRPELAALDPRWILRMTEGEFEKFFEATPMRRLGLDRLQRNACVVMGNTGESGDLSLLEETVHSHPSPMVRRHAEWAVGRLKLQVSLKP